MEDRSIVRKRKDSESTNELVLERQIERDDPKACQNAIEELSQGCLTRVFNFICSAARKTYWLLEKLHPILVAVSIALDIHGMLRGRPLRRRIDY